MIINNHFFREEDVSAIQPVDHEYWAHRVGGDHKYHEIKVILKSGSSISFYFGTEEQRNAELQSMFNQLTATNG